MTCHTSAATDDGPGGVCFLAPNPADGFVLPVGTPDAFGRASVTALLANTPSFVGLTFSGQSVVELGATGYALISTDLSAGLRITLA